MRLIEESNRSPCIFTVENSTNFKTVLPVSNKGFPTHCRLIFMNLFSLGFSAPNFQTDFKCSKLTFCNSVPMYSTNLGIRLPSSHVFVVMLRGVSIMMTFHIQSILCGVTRNWLLMLNLLKEAD